MSKRQKKRNNRKATPKPAKIPEQKKRSVIDLALERTEPRRYKRTAKTPYITTLSLWTAADILVALDQHERGDFSRSGMLWQWCSSRDPRLRAVLSRRAAALPALPFSVVGANFDDDSTPGEKAVARILEREWYTIFPESLIKGLVEQVVGMGAALCRVTWADRDGRWWPVLTQWPNDGFYFRDTDNAWYARQRNGGDVKICPGYGWFLWLPAGARSFQKGSVLSLALACFITNMVQKDWANYNHANGAVVRKCYVPRGATPEQKEDFLTNVEALDVDTSSILLEQNRDKSGFDLQYETPGGTTITSFQEAKAEADKDKAIEILGQSLTTDTGGVGSQALGTVHEKVAAEKFAADANEFATAARLQLLMPWALYNFNDPLLAPWPEWDVVPSSNKADEANTLRTVGYVLSAIRSGLVGTGIKLDVRAWAEKFDVPFIEGNDIPPVADAPPIAATAYNELVLAQITEAIDKKIEALNQRLLSYVQK